VPAAITSTVTYCWSVTPDSGTIIELLLNVGTPATAVPAETATLPLVKGWSNVNTTV